MVFEWFSFGKSVDWIGKLWGKLDRRRKAYRAELDEINTIVYEDPLEIARYYIEPECQDYNPADYESEAHPATTRSVFEIVDKFFRKDKSCPGDNQLFVLSDAGMGKTALLTMLKLAHLTSFWPKRTACVLKKLDEKTIEEIKKVPEKRKTVLLLDSLDEDTSSFGRIRDRVVEILRETQSFKKVVITCRTQFFPKGADNPFKRPDLVNIGGFICPVKYLSFFSDAKVTSYLSKRFPKKFGLLPDRKKIAEASRVIEKMGALRCRPMLLSYIDELMDSPLAGENESEYHVYDALVQSWLNREETKSDVSRDELMNACVILAAVMNMRRVRRVSESDLDKLVEKITDIRPVKNIDIKGRSLINRDSEGKWRFSHFSIQEFCVAKLLLGEKVFTPRKSIQMTDLIMKWMLELGKSPNFPELLDFRDTQLSDAGLKSVCLWGANLAGVNLQGADLRGTDLSNADLRGANLREADFNGVIIRGTRFDWEMEISNDLGMKFVFIPPGKFMMGSPGDEPKRGNDESLHKVTLTRGFHMMTTPVTVGHWKAYVGETGYQSEAEKGDGAYGWTGSEWKKKKEYYWGNPGFKQTDNHPVTCVSWNDAKALIEWLNKREGGQYRLPTEAEWEYACRAGTETPFFFGKCLSTNRANYDGNYPYEGCPKGEYRQGTTPVDAFEPNTWDLRDMHGNVWEWCEDLYDEYSKEETVDPKGADSGSNRLLRGGSWIGIARNCRSANRLRDAPGIRDNYVGFRLARSLP